MTCCLPGSSPNCHFECQEDPGDDVGLVICNKSKDPSLPQKTGAFCFVDKILKCGNFYTCVTKCEPCSTSKKNVTKQQTNNKSVLHSKVNAENKIRHQLPRAALAAT